MLIVDICGSIQLFTVPTDADVEKNKMEIRNETLRKIENKKETFALELNVLNQSGTCTQISFLGIF